MCPWALCQLVTHCVSAPNLCFFACFVTPEFDPSDCSSPFPRIKLYHESGVMESTRQEPEWTPSSSVLLASWRQTHLLMERPLNLHGPAGHTLRQISSPPQQQAALAPQRQAPSWQACHHSGCRSQGAQQKLHPQSFFVIREVQHSSVTATTAPQKSETQPCRGSALKAPRSFLICVSLSICYLSTPWNSLFPF